MSLMKLYQRGKKTRKSKEEGQVRAWSQERYQQKEIILKTSRMWRWMKRTRLHSHQSLQ